MWEQRGSRDRPHRQDTVTRSCGNVFADLRVAEPAETLAKPELAALVVRAFRARRLSRTDLAEILGIDQPVSRS